MDRRNTRFRRLDGRTSAVQCYRLPSYYACGGGGGGDTEFYAAGSMDPRDGTSCGMGEAPPRHGSRSATQRGLADHPPRDLANLTATYPHAFNSRGMCFFVFLVLCIVYKSVHEYKCVCVYI